jgi:MFS transporter, AAHS family, 4-hydroxybenzoate transporter
LAIVASTTDNGSLNVQQFVDNLPMARTQWLIVGLCFLVLMTDGLHTAAMAFVAPALTRELSISRLALGPVLAAALVGLAIGALAAGPLADRFGRKRVLVASVLICSVGSLCTASASGIMSLLVFRFITGTGIGAAMPNCTTLAAEFLPVRSRALLLNLMFCGFPLGASAGGFLAAWLIPHFGWRSLFLIGGAAPLILTGLLTRLPESISFMVVRQYPVQQIRIALNRIAGHDAHALAQIAASSSFCMAENTAVSMGSPLQVMFAPGLLVGTLMLWLSYFMGLLLFYLLTSWMPTLVRDAGNSVSQAATTTALFPLGGGIGAILCGWLMGRINAARVVSTAYFATAVLMLVLAHSTGSLISLMCMTFLAGLAMNAAQTSMPALAAASYPTYGRASGVSWMLGVGRIGGIVGAFGGGFLLQAGFSLTQIISGLAVVAAVPGVALLCKDYASRRDSLRAAESST